MEILDLLTLVFCVFAVVLNAAAGFVLLKRKSGKATPAYSLVFASLAFLFIIIGCIGYLFSDDVIAVLATLALSGLCMIIYCATEKIAAPHDEHSFEGEQTKYYNVSDFDFSQANSLEDELPLDDDDGLDFEASSGDFSLDDLGFSADDLDDLDLDFSLDTDLNDDDFDAVFPPDDDALFVHALLDDDEAPVRGGLEATDADDELSDDAVLDEEFETVFDFSQDEDEALLPAQDVAIEDVAFEEDAGIEGPSDFAEDAGVDEAPSFESELLESEAATSFTEDEEERILKAGQELVAQVSESIQGGINLDALLDFANRSLMENTGADGGIIFLVDYDEDVLIARAFSGQFPPPYKLPDDTPHTQDAVEAALRSARLSLSGNIFAEAAFSAEPICIEDGESDERVFQNGYEPFLVVGSYMIAPFSVNDMVVGVAGLARPPQKEPFSQKDFRAAKALAGYAAAALGNVYAFQEIMERADLESDVDAAAKIQRTFLPKKLPELAEAGFGFFFREAEGVCTDYCEVIFARRDRIALVVADVAGKGIISGMIMTSLRALLHLVTNTTKSAATILEWVNKSIADKNIDIDHYAALSYVSYSLETNELEYASAGQQAVLLWRAAESRVETVRIEAEPLGVDRAAEYKERKLAAAPGDIVVLFTDGLVEALNPQGEQYGIDGLSKAVADNSRSEAKEIAAAIRRDIEDFTGSAALHDDQTLLVMKIKKP